MVSASNPRLEIRRNQALVNFYVFLTLKIRCTILVLVDVLSEEIRDKNKENPQGNDCGGLKGYLEGMLENPSLANIPRATKKNSGN